MLIQHDKCNKFKLCIRRFFSNICFTTKKFITRYQRKLEDVHEKTKIQFLLEKCHPWESYGGWGGLEQYKLLSSGSESDKMKEDNALNFYKTRNSNSIIVKIWLDLKGTLLGLRQFLATESPTKMMKSAFYFTKKALRETT